MDGIRLRSATYWIIAALSAAGLDGSVARGQVDCNTNGFGDAADISSGRSLDCNVNGVPDECDPIGVDLAAIQANLNANVAQITSLVPDRHDFLEGETGFQIVDGGLNMYDGGNVLNTSRASGIAYTNGVITGSAAQFGPGSSYFTAKYPGLFVLAANQTAIDLFLITGDLGADGAGLATTATLPVTTADGTRYTVYLKRVSGAPTPSVNHLFIIPGDGAGVTRTFSANTNDDLDLLGGIRNINHFFYLLVSRGAGGLLGDQTAVSIAEAFLRQRVIGGADCNTNGALDSCDVALGVSRDVDSNRVPDECEPDCNTNLVPDAMDIRLGASGDCNTNRVPDECETDCNRNRVADVCELAAGSSADCNGNSVLDGCDIAGGTSGDCGGNGVPDVCEGDCNSNGVTDDCDIVRGTSRDCDSSGVPDECEVGNLTLEAAVENLNLGSAAISALVPDRFDFTEGITGTFIGDGGNDMYDNGNFLNTDRAGAIPYTNAVIMNSDAEFGPGSRYFTAKYAGLFVMVATDIAINRFEITGDVGADGGGSVDGAVLGLQAQGQEYTLYVKRIFNTTDPSVNHIIIVEGGGAGVSHSFSPDTNNDLHTVSGLGGHGNLYYILTARASGQYLADADVLNIAAAFLQQASLSGEDCNLNLVPDSCDIAGGASSDRNANDIPDECETDCNSNRVPDDQDLVGGTSEDCNANTIMDECDVMRATSQDRNQNVVPDECEPDCNTNGRPDDMDIAAGTSQDCGNGVPDECENDCNTNGVVDDCDIVRGTSEDCGGNSIPDNCEMAGLAGDLVLAFFALDLDPGWTTEGDWAWGIPTGPSNPPSGFTGRNVYGYNLRGDYQDNMGIRRLTSTSIDCRAGRNVRLRFRRWLGIESSTFDRANIQVSNDGRTWTTVWEHAGNSFQETSWSLQEYDISAVADTQSSVYVRWGLGPTDTSVTFSGWKLDDIAIVADAVPDCNQNGVLDACDIVFGTSADVDSDGTPDACEFDCDSDGIPDDAAIAAGAADCDRNNVPDSCEPDCNTNNVADACDLAADSSMDCNRDDVPDECELSAGSSTDCNADGQLDECPVCPPIEAVFIMDTSGSMDDEAAALCQAIPAIVAELQLDEITVNATLLGLTQMPGAEYGCLTGTVLAQFGPNVPGNPPPGFQTWGSCNGDASDASEDWGLGSAVVAGRYPWPPNALRVVVPISDEGPYCGDPASDPGPDRIAIEHAITVAQANAVIVSPITGTDADPEVIVLAQALAAGTGGLAFSSSLPAEDIADRIRNLILSACLTFSDCNSNGMPDDCDIGSGASQDTDHDGVPDECNCTPPQIILQPTSVTVCAGDAVTLVIAATPAGVRFQWRQNGVGIAGATGDVFVIPASTPDHFGTYDVVITNPCGQAISDAAVVVPWPRSTADTNGDGLTNGQDIAGFVEEMRTGGAMGASLAFCASDMNADGAITRAGDLALFISRLLGRP